MFSQMFQPNMFGSHQHMLEMTDITSQREMALPRDDVFETKSGAELMEAASEDEQDPDQPPRKKRYNRHTQLQIQEMEAFFKKCPHPDEKKRKELGRQLGLKPLQVKFWFQNKRTQMKAQHERHENAILKAENDKFRAENKRYMEAFSNASCPNCGGPAALGEMSFDDHHVRIENVRLGEEVDKMATKYVGRPFASYNHSQSDVGVGGFGWNAGYVYGANELVMSMSRPTEADKPVIVEIAVAAMEELVSMAEKGQPFWIPAGDNASEILNEEEYLKLFPRDICSKPLGLVTEASRQSAVVVMNHIKLIEIFMDVNKWSTVFCGIVSRALLLEVLSTGVAGNRNGALQVITAEFQVPTPLVPTRENYMVRYCKKHGEGTWAIVDVSLDTLRPTSMTKISRRRPSGCLIQELPNGFSKVTWVEHVEEDSKGVHNLYQSLVSSGLAFGAKRWVATLDRQCERLASSMANDIAAGDLSILTNPEGRKSMVKLAERMVMTFCSGVGASTAHTWTTLPAIGSDDVRVMSRRSTDGSGRPLGIVLSAVTSFWMPVSPQRVFDFLRNYNSRNQWDILSNGGLVQEMAYISNGRHVGNSVSLLRVNSANSSQSNMLILQESCTDSTGCYVIYAPVDIAAMNVVLNGGDPDYSALLPSGFAILPDGAGRVGDGVMEVGSGGSLLTVAFQILVDSVPTSKISVGSIATVNSLIKCTVQRIRAAVACENPRSNKCLNMSALW